eukprot:3593687-Rhodomonas_salina.1
MICVHSTGIPCMPHRKSALLAKFCQSRVISSPTSPECCAVPNSAMQTTTCITTSTTRFRIGLRILSCEGVFWK